MFTLVRRYIKTALAFFVAGLVTGFWLILERAFGPWGATHALVSAHTHLLLYGFVIFLIMGVAYWMFPRPAKEDIRYSPKLAELNFWMAAIGTVIRTIGEFMEYFSLGGPGMYAVIAGSTLQLLAGLVFAWNIWSRIRPIGSQHREAKGERF